MNTLKMVNAYIELTRKAGTPMITFELVKQYAQQIDELRKRLNARST